MYKTYQYCYGCKKITAHKFKKMIGDGVHSMRITEDSEEPTVIFCCTNCSIEWVHLKNVDHATTIVNDVTKLEN